MSESSAPRPPATINPYLIAAKLVARRLAWDLRPVAWSARRRLRQLRDSQCGRKAVILCNGPSLLRTDFDRLGSSDAFVIGLNKVNLLFERTSLRPDAIVAVNPLVIEQNRDFYNETRIGLFLDSIATAHVRRRDSVVFLKSAHIRMFARDCSLSVSQGFTVTFVALQLAYHLGCTQVALVGCDHNFEAKGAANATVRADNADVNHFDPRYFSSGVLWQLPDLLQSEVHYLLAREAFESDDRLLVNSTEGGKLEIFQRMDLERFLSLPPDPRRRV